MILECFRAILRYVSPYFLSVSPAVTWLTVYCRLQWEGAHVPTTYFGCLAVQSSGVWAVFLKRSHRYMYTYVYIYTYICIHMYTHMYVCNYIYIISHYIMYKTIYHITLYNACNIMYICIRVCVRAYVC